MANLITTDSGRKLKKKYRVIYTPSGAAREYSELAVNLANGCSHGCIYCYVPPFRRTTRKAYRENVTLRKGFERKLELDLQEMASVKDDRRVLLCFMTDPYQPELADYTRKVLQQFKKYDIAFNVLTKNGKLAMKDFDLYDTSKDAYSVTLVFSEEESRKHYEPFAGTIDERLQSLKQAHALGIETWVSVEPVIDARQALEAIDLTAPYTDHYKIGKVNGFRLEEPQDWRRFTLDTINKLEDMGKPYYIKKSLQPYV